MPLLLSLGFRVRLGSISCIGLRLIIVSYEWFSFWLLRRQIKARLVDILRGVSYCRLVLFKSFTGSPTGLLLFRCRLLLISRIYGKFHGCFLHFFIGGSDVIFAVIVRQLVTLALVGAGCRIRCLLVCRWFTRWSRQILSLGWVAAIGIREVPDRGASG